MDAFESLKKANEIRRSKKTKPKDLIEKQRAKSRAYYQRNAEVLREKRKAYYEAHKAEIAEKRKTDDKHREYMRNYSRERTKMMQQMGMSSMSDENRIEFNLRRKERYANDPEYRKRILENNKKYRLKKQMEK